MNMRPSFDTSVPRSIEDQIERLIALLDAIDGDENMEPDLAGFDRAFMDDREGDDEREFDEAESGIADFDALHSEDTFLEIEKLDLELRTRH